MLTTVQFITELQQLVVQATVSLRYLLSTALGHDRRNHVTSGSGRPVALHVSLTESPSRTVTSELDKWSMI